MYDGTINHGKILLGDIIIINFSHNKNRAVVTNLEEPCEIGKNDGS